MSDPQTQFESADRLPSIAADFARVLWSPSAVFRRRRTTRARRVLLVLWVIMTVLGFPMFLSFVLALPEAYDARVALILALLIAPFAAVMFLLLVATLEGGAVWLGATSLGHRLPLRRAVLVAAFSSSVLTLFAIPEAIAFLSTDQLAAFAENPQPPDTPAWVEAFMLNLSPLAPESRPVLGLLLSFLGVPAIWLAALHAIGAREIGGVPRAVKFTLPVFWAASIAVTLVAAGIFYPFGRWADEAARAAERAAAAADTIRAPARAP